jgi:type III restriction enzyme
LRGQAARFGTIYLARVAKQSVARRQDRILRVANPFFEHPILNSPYLCPARHWELDDQGQPTQKIIETRRRAEFVTPIPKPRKRRRNSAQENFVFDEGHGLSTREQQYDPTSIINEVRGQVNRWRAWPKASEWQVTPETARDSIAGANQRGR